MSEVRVPDVVSEPLTQGTPNVRVPDVITEAVVGGEPEVLVPDVHVQPLTEGTPNVRVSLVIVQALFPVEPEPTMSTDPFPGFGNSTLNNAVPAGADPFSTALPGLSFSVHKTPTFKTKISEAVSGNEIRNAMAQYPRWDFELEYEFLEDRTGAESSLKTIMGFFLARQGSFDSWLFKDPDDYLVVNGECGTSDGVTTEFPFCRPMGGFLEKVGQVDTTNTINVYLSVEEAGAIPATPGPYTITVANAADYVADMGVTKGGIALTKVTGAPAASEYSVNETTGVYTFNATDQGDQVVISYRYDIASADYTVTMPNLIVFDSAPPGGTVSADFQFYFACRFMEDRMEFEKFLDKLWNLQSCEFRSIIQ